MGLRIATNISSIQTNRRVSHVSKERQRTLERLSAGDRIVRSGDDAAGLSISDKLRAGIRSMQMATRNTMDGISMIQTAEGGIVEAQNILIRLRELSVQAASDTIGDWERQQTDKEFQHLKAEVNRIAQTTNFNGTPLLNGMGPALEFQVGIDNDSNNDRIHFSSGISNVTASALGISGARIDTKEKAFNNLPSIDQAISELGKTRAYLGGIQSSLGSHIQNLGIHRQNLSEGNSRIRDADYAIFTTEATKQSILLETSTAVAAQANKLGSGAVKLIEKA